MDGIVFKPEETADASFQRSQVNLAEEFAWQIFRKSSLCLNCFRSQMLHDELLATVTSHRRSYEMEPTNKFKDAAFLMCLNSVEQHCGSLY